MLELVALRAQRAFGRAKRDTLPRYCQRVRGALCLQRRVPAQPLHRAPDGEPGLNYLCAGYKAFFEHIDRPMRVMAGLLRRGRYADEAMGILRSARAHPARRSVLASTWSNRSVPFMRRKV